MNRPQHHQEYNNFQKKNHSKLITSKLHKYLMNKTSYIIVVESLPKSVSHRCWFMVYYPKKKNN